MSELLEQDANDDQKTYWTDGPGRDWIQRDEVLTELMHQVNVGLVARAQVGFAERILDVGCGAGSTSIAFAKRVGPRGSIVGTDIALPMLQYAKDRAKAAKADMVEFLEADSQTHPFPEAGFDHIVSRFGVMFFSDPTAAFSNLRRALAPRGRMSVACWGPAALNPWFKIPRDAAIARLGEPEPVSPRAPGPMALADKAYATGIFGNAGFEDIAGELAHVDLCPPGGVHDAAQLATTLGPAVRIMREKGATEDDKQAILQDIATAFQQYRTVDGMRIPAAVWYYSAINP